jgi:hypothetical protein
MPCEVTMRGSNMQRVALQRLANESLGILPGINPYA